MTEVVAALIEHGKKILICQRPACKARGLLWEFVGGKVEPGETKPEALAWVTVGELDRYAFCPADTEILALLKGGTRP